MKSKFLLLFTFLCSATCSITLAQKKQTKTISENATLNKAFYENLVWRNIGPIRGGRSLGSAGSPSRPNEYYFGATGGGLWKTTDGGNEWEAVTDGQITSSSVGAVAVSETNPDIVYIGMGEV